jgi:hypothetical protein
MTTKSFYATVAYRRPGRETVILSDDLYFATEAEALEHARRVAGGARFYVEESNRPVNAQVSP